MTCHSQTPRLLHPPLHPSGPSAAGTVPAASDVPSLGHMALHSGRALPMEQNLQAYSVHTQVGGCIYLALQPFFFLASQTNFQLGW